MRLWISSGIWYCLLPDYDRWPIGLVSELPVDRAIRAAFQAVYYFIDSCLWPRDCIHFRENIGIREKTWRTMVGEFGSESISTGFKLGHY